MCHKFFELVNSWCTSQGPILLDLHAAIVAHLHSCETCRSSQDHSDELARWQKPEVDYV
jgi:hypothetical protein